MKNASKKKLQSKSSRTEISSTGVSSVAKIDKLNALLVKLRKALDEHKKASEDKREDLRMSGYKRIYVVYWRYHDAPKSRIDKLKGLFNITDPREHLWNGLIKKLGVQRSQASKVVTTFEYALAKNKTSSEYESFVKGKGGIGECAKKYKKPEPESTKVTEGNAPKGLKLIGTKTLIRSAKDSEGSLLLRVIWSEEENALRLERVFAGRWYAKRKGQSSKRAKREEIPSDNDNEHEVADEEKEADDEEESEEPLEEEWKNEHLRRLNLQ
jgi:hypothetical protein